MVNRYFYAKNPRLDDGNLILIFSFSGMEEKCSVCPQLVVDCGISLILHPIADT
ncbi:hypothetical protein [Aneurinibacillus migulanus]|uniref:hypothetical protein n=1 Tax=Aneurinibacillus migulanus TaxID=47500 RepID=UPI00130DEA3D|nr:hypothetical protein [Aneurinibacillus migulanus]MED0896673.1 hypothetical protein [Aneurinibacillus migulanus]MED1617250.1 hypothetical protein [Aneurinibacillus migulanus]